MHDPLVVAWDVCVPWPRRRRWEDAKREGDWRWGIHRWRRNDGSAVRPWYRPDAWRCRVAGRGYGLLQPLTIWHVEPRGHDSGTVCKWKRQKRDGKWVYTRRWAWHVWHWRIQWHFAQKLRRFLFERCIECGLRYPWGYAPVSHQWDGPRSKWFRVNRQNYHHNCSALGHLRQQRAMDEALLRTLFAALRVSTDESEEALLSRLTDPKKRSMEFLPASRLTAALGWKRDDNYRLIPAEAPDDVV